MIKKAGYFLLGIVLLVSTIATGDYGLSKQNIEIYKKALSLQEDMKHLFSDYQLSDYPVSFFDGNHDYVVTGDGTNYEVKKREPVLPTFVGTAYPVEDHYEIIVPTIEKFSEMFDLLGSAEKVSQLSSGGDISFDEASYGDKEQVATIWHEGFHAYQMSHFEDNIIQCLQGRSFGENGFGEQMIVDCVDNNDKIVAYYEQEMALLKKMVLSDNVDEIKANIVQYKKLDEQRKSLLPEDILLLEEYYERVEGTAFYVESSAYARLESNEKYMAHYIDPMDIFSNGSHKYYSMGMAKCRILDKLSPDWKNGYTFAESLTDLLYQYGEK